jgi:pimeloyl-ACP methyl ester carboxylesterase
VPGKEAEVDAATDADKDESASVAVVVAGMGRRVFTPQPCRLIRVCQHSTGDGMEVNGLSLHVEDHGAGTPVLLLHGWPDSTALWRHQVPFLVDNGYRAIAYDLRGFGRSDKPQHVASYALAESVADLVGVMDGLDLERAHLVGHDFGAAVCWVTAALHPDRVDRLVALSVPHPTTARGIKQREMSWYQLFFQFEGVAEEWLQHDDWTLLREFLRSDGDIDRYVEDLARPGALSASLSWYRAIFAPRPPAPPPALPRVQAPTLGVWSSGDHYLDEARMIASESLVDGEWRYERLEGPSHWIPLDAPDRLNELLVQWLR